MKKNNKKIRLLFIIWSFTYGGGAETVLANFVNSLDLEKYEVDILEYWHSNTQKLKVDSRIRILKPVVDSTRATKVEKLLKKIILENFPNILRRKFIKDRYDFEISFNYMIPTFFLSKKSKNIAWFHGDIYDLKENKRNRRLQEKSLKKVNRIVAISQNTYNSIIDVFPQYKDKIVIINNSFNIKKIFEESKEFNVKKNKFTMLFGGRLDENKNPLFLIEVANILKSKNLDFELWILGQGALQEQINKKVIEYDLESIVKLYGYQKNSYPYIAASDIVLISSYSEGFPTILAEGMALGKPFVSTNVGGVYELSNNGKCGLISNKIDEYARYIEDLIKSKVLYNKMSSEAKRNIEKFTIQKQLEKFEKILEEVRCESNDKE